MTLPDHGRATRYRDHGCRCEDCTRAATRQLKAYRVATRADHKGRPTVPMRVPIGPIRDHIAALLASGWTRRTLAAEVGVSHDHMHWIITGPSRSMHRTRAAVILAVPPLPVDDAPDAVAVDRLLAGSLDWREASRADRLEAGRIAMRREGGYAFCESVLHLGPRAIRRLRDEVRAERVAS